MTTPTPPTYGDLGFSYEFSIDIDLGFPGGAEDWAQVAFITNAGDANEKTFADVATYYDKGSARQTITGENWSLTFDHQIQRNPDGTFIDVLQTLVEAAKFGKRNDDAKVHVRFYDSEGADWAWEGTAYVAMSRANRGNTDVGSYTFTLTGDGPLTDITNPFSQALAVVTAATPTAVVEGGNVAIVGHDFLGATQVKFGAVNATSFTVDSDTHITAVMPAGSAGSAPVTVVKASGTSVAFAYTRGA